MNLCGKIFNLNNMTTRRQKGNALVGLLIVFGLIWGVTALFSGGDNYNGEYHQESYQNVDHESSDRHYDNSYEYNYRSGYSGSYEYSYDVEGYGEGGYVYGTVDTSGKYGEGYVYDEDGNELWVETEWTNYGVLEAYDEEGNWYELETY